MPAIHFLDVTNRDGVQTARTVGAGQEDAAFRLVQLCAAATGKSLTDDELRLVAYPDQLSLLYPGLMT